jgi:hypothetical protein
MILPEKREALRLITDLVNRGAHGEAIAAANGLKDILGIPPRLRLESIVKNGDFYQAALRDKLTGKAQLLAFGLDSAWEWGPGEWLPLPPSHPLADLAKIPEALPEPHFSTALLPYLVAGRW